MALAVQKLWRKKISKSVSGYFKTKIERKKEVSMVSKPGGGVKALVARAPKKEIVNCEKVVRIKFDL